MAGPMPEPGELVARQVSVDRGGRRVLDGVDLEARRGRVLAVTGPSGAGKSTLLAVLAGLLTPRDGTVQWLGEPMRTADARAGREVGVVLQGYGLLPLLTAHENVRLPLKLARLGKADADARIAEALTRVGLADFADAFPRELSGGMKMRVSLARALVTDPDILLMDEPFAALDEITRFRLNDDLLSLWRNLRKTVIFVTHSVFESVYLSQRVVVMTERPGRIGAEIRIDVDEARGEAFRTSVAYAEYCRRVSAALAPSYSGRSSL